VTEHPGLSGGNNAHAGTRARPAPRPDPLDELRGDLAAILTFLEATRPPAALGRKRSNRLGHSLEAVRRELRRALEAAGAGPGSAGS
jgi:hypothetical protein